VSPSLSFWPPRHARSRRKCRRGCLGRSVYIRQRWLRPSSIASRERVKPSAGPRPACTWAGASHPRRQFWRCLCCPSPGKRGHVHNSSHMICVYELFMSDALLGALLKICSSCMLCPLHAVFMVCSWRLVTVICMCALEACQCLVSIIIAIAIHRLGWQAQS
jgi:hypothetical protein